MEGLIEEVKNQMGGEQTKGGTAIAINIVLMELMDDKYQEDIAKVIGSRVGVEYFNEFYEEYIGVIQMFMKSVSKAGKKP